MGSKRFIRAPWPASSGREPAAVPAVTPSSAIEFVTFAASGDIPVSRSAG